MFFPKIVENGKNMSHPEFYNKNFSSIKPEKFYSEDLGMIHCLFTPNPHNSAAMNKSGKSQRTFQMK